MSKSKSSRFPNPFEIDKGKSKKWTSVLDALALFNIVQVDKFDPPCLQSLDCQYLKYHLVS